LEIQDTVNLGVLLLKHFVQLLRLGQRARKAVKNEACRSHISKMKGCEWIEPERRRCTSRTDVFRKERHIQICRQAVPKVQGCHIMVQRISQMNDVGLERARITCFVAGLDAHHAIPQTLRNELQERRNLTTIYIQLAVMRFMHDRRSPVFSHKCAAGEDGAVGQIEVLGWYGQVSCAVVQLSLPQAVTRV
jgi:hypothetical protein